MLGPLELTGNRGQIDMKHELEGATISPDTSLKGNVQMDTCFDTRLLAAIFSPAATKNSAETSAVLNLTVYSSLKSLVTVY